MRALVVVSVVCTLILAATLLSISRRDGLGASLAVLPLELEARKQLQSPEQESNESPNIASLQEVIQHSSDDEYTDTFSRDSAVPASYRSNIGDVYYSELNEAKAGDAYHQIRVAYILDECTGYKSLQEINDKFQSGVYDDETYAALLRINQRCFSLGLDGDDIVAERKQWIKLATDGSNPIAMASQLEDSLITGRTSSEGYENKGAYRRHLIDAVASTPESADHLHMYMVLSLLDSYHARFVEDFDDTQSFLARSPKRGRYHAAFTLLRCKYHWSCSMEQASQHFSLNNYYQHEIDDMDQLSLEIEKALLEGDPSSLSFFYDSQ